MGTRYSDKGAKPEGFKYLGYDHVTLYVGNAKQASDWYISRFGFKYVAYSGLETGARDVARHVVQQNKITLVFCSPYSKSHEINDHVTRHGDAVKDVAFAVDDCRAVYSAAVARGAVSVAEPKELTDEHGTVVLATIRTYGDTTHTFVQRGAYKGAFLPGFKYVERLEDGLERVTPAVGLSFIDHVVGNQDWDQMTPVADWYVNVLQFHRFWSVDDKTMHTEYSALNSTVVADYDEVVKMPINEPAKALKKSQIEEYVDYYNGAGVQHIALNTRDIITAITHLRSRGLRFLNIPPKYYAQLRERLQDSPISVKEDMAMLEKLNILVDFDDKGYLLQIFTEPVEDRPTLFYEVIQRENNSGFGAGNFKALFKSIEIEQERRGNLQ